MIGKRRALALALALALWPGASAGSARDSQEPPAVDARAAILEDASDGHVLLAHAPHQRRQIASTTKLMTALLTLERTRPDDVLTAAPYEATPVESQIGLEEGERMRADDLLTALLLESANDAAATLAVGVSGSQARFVDEMNERARQLDLDDTRYANPIGFDDAANYSSAEDLAALTRLLLRDERFAAIVRRPRAVLRSGDRRRVVENRNRLVGRLPAVDGVKTGQTAGAGHVLVGSASARRAQVVSVVLGAASAGARDAATRELLSYGLDQFRRKTVLRSDRPLASVAVAGHDANAQLTTPRDVVLTVRRGAGGVDRRVSAPAQIEGPLDRGEQVGSVQVLSSGEAVRRAPLVTAAPVPAPGVADRVGSALERPLTWMLVVAIVSASAVALLRMRSSRAQAPDVK